MSMFGDIPQTIHGKKRAGYKAGIKGTYYIIRGQGVAGSLRGAKLTARLASWL